jgi:hypothetical protein
LAGTQADFALIEKYVFNYLLLSKAAAKTARRRFAFAPLPLIFTSAEKNARQLAAEVIEMPMNKLLRPRLKEMTEALHLLAEPKHWVKGQYARFYMTSSNIKHIDSEACRSLLFFCHKHIHSQKELRCVATVNHTTQIIIKPRGGCTPMHHDGPTGTKKAVENDKGEKKEVTDYDRPSRKQLCVQANEYCRTTTAIGIKDHQKISSLFLESDARVVGDDGVRGSKMTIEYSQRKAGETLTMGPFANGMRVALLLQPMASAGSGNRLTTVRFKHCTGHTLEKEVTTVVDAATKALPLHCLS